MKRFERKTTGLLNGIEMRNLRYKAVYGMIILLLVLLSLICLLPILWVVISGFKTPAELYSVPPRLLPSSVNLGHIAEVWTKINFFKYFKNTFLLIAGALISDIMLNGLAGYVLSKVRPLGSALLETVIFGTMLLPSISMAPLYMTFVDMPITHTNLTGTFLPLWMQAGCSAFNIMLFRNFFNGIPKDYLEAARIDGCASMNAFFRIVLPLSKPILVVETIFCVINSWKSFMWPYLMLGNTKKETISILLYQISSSSTMAITETETMLVIMLCVVPPMIFYAIFSKQIMDGLDMSGIKG